MFYVQIFYFGRRWKQGVQQCQSCEHQTALRYCLAIHSKLWCKVCSPAVYEDISENIKGGGQLHASSPTSASWVSPQLTGEGLFFAPTPLVFSRYLPKLQTDHHEICSTLLSIYLAHPDRTRTRFDTSAVNNVRVTSSLLSFS